MRHADTFSSCHPLVNFLYFALVLGCTMFLTHPACICIFLASAFAYQVMLKGGQAVGSGLRYLLPMALLAAVVNPAFNHEGATILLYLPTGNPLTAESIWYGAASAAMLVSVVLWFSSCTEVLTTDKFVYLFGRVIPAMSLVLSMTLRFVPRFKAQFRRVSQSRRCLGRGVLPEAVTAEDVIYSCGGTLPQEEAPTGTGYTLPEKQSERAAVRTLPRWRKITAIMSVLVALGAFLKALSVTDLSALVTGGGLTEAAAPSLAVYLVLIAALAALAASIGRRSKPSAIPPSPARKGKLSKRTAAAAVMILLCIPVTLFVGRFYLGDRKYYFISLLVLLECMLPFFLVFEGRRPQARELVITAVLCALGVAGRVAFFMLPQFKPVMAITIIAGVAFGGETGFLVGSLTMLASNVFFSQGPLPPWQMFAMGIIGFLAGVLFRRGLLRRNREALAVFGAIAAIVVYGGIMNPASALTWSATVNWGVILTYYFTGFPMDCVQAAATALALFFAAEPMLEKLDRIKVKYGLVE